MISALVAAAPLVERLGVARLAGGDGVGQRLAVESWKLVTSCVEINQCVRPAWR